MVSFLTKGERPNLHLHIHDYKENDDTYLVVHHSLYKGHCPSWGSLSSKDTGGGMNWTPSEPSHQYVLVDRGHSRDEPPKIYLFLRESVATGRCAWRDPIALHGLFEYTLGYWEWVENILTRYSPKLSAARLYDEVRASLFTYEYSDALMKAFVECWSLSTNTLLLPHGEVSISLWDLCKLGGLVVAGHLMDEVVPSAECLPSSLDKSDRIAESCRFLLHAYHHLVSSSPDHSISMVDWIGFAESLRVFKLLEIPSTSSDEVYCAAFLSCWLCVFVLPLDPAGSIPHNVFKMASCMVVGKVVSLAIPVLASIYNGLHLITAARYPCNSGCCFPIHYLLGWI
ncbi:hypothetical protein LIER_29135 [Lithospermum erythrorhizon]|uniref:Aminotransferase-like plant mobile domain-containing protein n=1 Tax=Lithospermum erythrorhizon TaxID=34254 RepID=A0AAV3RJ64_LITER